MRFEPGSTFYPGDTRRSPTVLVGECPVGLVIFPKGTASTRGLHLSAFVEVRPRDDWDEDWEFPGVQVEIRVRKAANRTDDFCRRCTHTFTPECYDRGWHDFGQVTGYDALKSAGWISYKNVIHFHAIIEGESLARCWRRAASPFSSLWEEMKFTDMLVVAGEGGPDFECHRVVLAASSPVFDRMLSSCMKEGSEQQLVLPRATARAARALLAHVYLGTSAKTSTLDFEVVKELLRLAHQYELQSLVSQCAKQLAKAMTAGNACSVLALLKTLSDHPKVAEVYRIAKRKAKENDELFEALVSYAESSGAASPTGESDGEKRWSRRKTPSDSPSEAEGERWRAKKRKTLGE